MAPSLFTNEMEGNERFAAAGLCCPSNLKFGNFPHSTTPAIIRLWSCRCSFRRLAFPNQPPSMSKLAVDNTRTNSILV